MAGHRLSVPPGPFAYDFTKYADSDSLPFGLRDAHDIQVTIEDPLCIRDGAVAALSSQGGNYPTGPSGRRAYAWRQTRTLADNVYAYTISNGMGPIVHCNPSSRWIGVSAWYNKVFNWWELGYVGRNLDEFVYADLTISPVSISYDYAENTRWKMEIRSVAGQAWLLVDGQHMCGPVPLVEGLPGATRHGVQIDYFETSEVEVGSIPYVECGTFSGNVPIYRTPEIRTAGTFVKPTGTGTTVVPDLPAGIIDADVLVAIVADAGGGTWSASGWTGQGTVGNSTQRLSFFTRYPAAGEAGTVTFTKSGGSAGVRSAVILRVDNVHPTFPIGVNGTTNSSSTNVTGPTVGLNGVRRLGIWAAALPANVTVTVPDGWLEVGQTDPTGAALTLAVGQIDWDTRIVRLFKTTEQPPDVGTSSGAATSAVASAFVYGFPGI